MDFLEMARQRYSVRKYSDKCVEDEKIARILEAAKLAPTACNYQPQKIYVITSPEKLEELAKLTPCTFHASVVFAVGYDDTRSAKGMVYDDYDFGTTDAAIVCTHMMLQAWADGLGSCFVGYFKEAEVAKALGVPENVRIRELLPVGYPAENSVPAPAHAKSREMDDMVTFL